MKNIILAFLAVAVLSQPLVANAKKSLDHDDIDGWKSLKNIGISNDGKWSAYTVSPVEGDGELVLQATDGKTKHNIARGYKPVFSADSKWAVALVKPLFAQTRKAKIDKKKGDDLPQDSLVIIELRTGKQTKFPHVKDFKTGKDAGEWVACLTTDTAYARPKLLKDKNAGRPLLLIHMPSGKIRVVKNVKDFSFSDNGKLLAATLRRAESDSLSTDGIILFSADKETLTLLDRDKRDYGASVFNAAGTAMAYTAGNDTLKTGTRKRDLYFVDLAGDSVSPRRKHVPVDSLFYINQYSEPVFSHNGKRLVVGVGRHVAPDDTTIVDFERADLDIWRWDAPATPPQELKRAEKERARTYPVVLDLATGSCVTTPRNPLITITEGDRWDADWILLADPAENIVSFQWDYTAPEKLSLLNIRTGEQREVTDAYRESSELSPEGKYILWYDNRQMYAYNIESRSTTCITCSIPYPIWDEANDRPMMEEPYGTPFWTKDDRRLLVYDRHDIWSVDPDGKESPVCLTGGDGRGKNLRYRIINTDKEKRCLQPGEEMILSVFSYDTKENGIAFATVSSKGETPRIKMLAPYQFTQVQKAKNAEVYSYSKQNFHTSPDIYVSRGKELQKARKYSDINPQMADFSWGKAELVKWYAFDGRPVEGVLYVPEGIEQDKKYPLLSVFYETNSDDLYRYYALEPSWSWINYPFYVSRGYAVFVPDVHYNAGIPGEGAYNCIVSGIEELCRKYSWIDRNRIGIDGQSWGGYQTAYLITRTDMFACAGSGAPVANMTSAFGGIRWTSGDSRQAQYEQGQSRIGRNLWEAPELYIANSPLFKLNRVNTPLLIMHNDADGAVPWYQGIELFMGLRRLHKPVWMLQYNGEAHNLRQRKNCKDITIRLQQFFDHYLKDAPMPKWMKEGIPAVRKGQEMGY